ncbi:MAG: bifunctional phosphopantothenoylcysteine decarboxylase/phosphopantothenate--cysteine ligase CoaBC [Ginsengibacter sp.]
MKGKKILIGVTGSIAAYKSVLIVRLLVKEEAEVKVIMTPSSKDFVSPLTFSTLSKNKVLTELVSEDSWANHVELGRWADIFLIAPATCNTLAKMANGFCDNLLLAVYLSSTCPVMVAPAMDEDMWRHPATKLNLQKITSFGNTILPVDNGELASGLTGEGRMSEPAFIVEKIKDFFFKPEICKGLNVLITAGPTVEAIDPVRFISNHSSGKMGVAIAEEFRKRGASVTLILGPSGESVNHGIEIRRVTSAKEMYQEAISRYQQADIIIMAAAVADYTPAEISGMKIKKDNEEMKLNLKKTDDILKTIGGLKKDSQLLVGFALETDNEKENALKKLNGKKADFIILNSLKDEGSGFGQDTNKITIFDKKGGEAAFEKKSKSEVAIDIVNSIIEYKNA